MSLADTGRASSGEVRLSSIKVGERHRADLGDIDALMASMRDIGSLLQPIVLNKDLQLVAGFRRLEAAKRLGWATVSCRIVNGLDDALKALRAERDENTCRKDFTPSELVSMGAAIEEVERPKADERKAAAGKANLPTVSANLEIGTQRPTGGETNHIVGAALGVSGAHYSRAKRVVAAAEDPTDPAHAVAVEARAAMDDGTLTVTAAAEKVSAARRSAARVQVLGAANDKSKAAVAERRERIKALAARGYDVDQISKELGIGPKAVSENAKAIGVQIWTGQGMQRKVDPNVVMENGAADLAGMIETMLGHLDGRYAAIDPTKVDGWIFSLENTRKSLNRLMSNLKEKTRD